MNFLYMLVQMKQRKIVSLIKMEIMCLLPSSKKLFPFNSLLISSVACLHRIPKWGCGDSSATDSRAHFCDF